MQNKLERGAEYSWRYSKTVYRRHLLASRKGNENFTELITPYSAQTLQSPHQDIGW
jgi:hypothetical protein